jgi:phage-related protein
MATRGTGVATVLTATSVALVTAGANELVTVVRAQVQNTDTVARLVTVHQVASGGSATTSNQVHVQTVYAGQSTSLDIAGMMAAAGAALYFKADVGSVVNLSLNVFRSDQTP